MSNKNKGYGQGGQGGSTDANRNRNNGSSAGGAAAGGGGSVAGSVPGGLIKLGAGRANRPPPKVKSIKMMDMQEVARFNEQQVDALRTRRALSTHLTSR
jgi:hypothetical protein